MPPDRCCTRKLAGESCCADTCGTVAALRIPLGPAGASSGSIAAGTARHIEDPDRVGAVGGDIEVAPVAADAPTDPDVERLDVLTGALAVVRDAARVAQRPTWRARVHGDARPRGNEHGP